MSSTSTKPSTTTAERDRDALMRRHGIDHTDENRATLAAYQARTRRARWWGVVGALIAGGIGLLGSTEDAGALGIARLFIGYLVGSAAAELFSPQRRAAGAIHTASLTTREPNLLLPVWARILPWLFLAPCLASPLLMLGDHPSGVTRVRDQTGSAMVTAHWFPSPVLISAAVLAATGLVFWRLILRRLARRRLPVDKPGAARLDLLTRALSARAVSGTAAALGMSLLAGLAYLSVEPLNSMTCSTPADCHYVYAWHAQYNLIQNLGLLTLLAAIMLFSYSRRPRITESMLQSAIESPR